MTNQVVKSCKSYLTDNGKTRIWDQPSGKIIEKIQACVTLYEVYQKAFQKTKCRADSVFGENKFECSEMYIFGKFDAFCKRLEKVVLERGCYCVMRRFYMLIFI